MFSKRLPVRYDRNSLLSLREEKLARGDKIIDLTVSNPTAVGLAIPENELRGAFASGEWGRYAPEPRGLLSAREAVADYYRARGDTVSPDAIFMTASTSESYAQLFKLLGDPGDGVLVPVPSYPLFETLLGLENLAPIPYSLSREKGWAVTRQALERAVLASSARPRALIAVNPNNPTGHFLSAEDVAVSIAFAKAHDLALIVDEVFWDFAIASGVPKLSSVAIRDILTFTLNGISKRCGAPQLKLAWIAVSGPPDRVAAAVHHLDFIADAFLSVATPVQLALPALLALPQPARIAARVCANLNLLQDALTQFPSLRLIPPQGGWSAVLSIETGEADDTLCERLLRDCHVWTQPGYFFDFPSGEYLIMSLLTTPSIFSVGLQRMRFAFL